MIKHGDSRLTLQTGWEIDEDENGLLTGQCTWIGDIAHINAFALASQGGILHPGDPRLTSYKQSKKRLTNQRCSITLSFIGIVSDPTPFIIEHPGGSGQEPIETHPWFSTYLAGTKESPMNGAKFDSATGEFLGFFDPSNDLVGTRSYIVPSVIINASWYSHVPPYIGSVGRISYPPVTTILPYNVRNYLVIGVPYRQIGNLYHCSAAFMGSGSRGWHPYVYNGVT
ncbi:MAG: hypothetical protein IPK22_11285 [Verrucomicrobiaceae bacterium]|nr:hypothetical protein [Verrucomicrobiaceae bacterium]